MRTVVDHHSVKLIVLMLALAGCDVAATDDGATAYLWVTGPAAVDVRPNVPNGQKPTYQQIITTHVEMLASAAVSSSVLDTQLDAKKTSWYKSYKPDETHRRLRDLRKGIRVEAVKDTSLIAVSVNVGNAVDSATLCNALLDAYRVRCLRNNRLKAGELVQLWTSHARRLQEDVESLRARIRKAEDSLGLTPMLIKTRIDAIANLSPDERKTEKWQTEIEHLQEEYRALQNETAKLEQLKDELARTTRAYHQMKERSMNLQLQREDPRSVGIQIATRAVPFE